MSGLFTEMSEGFNRGSVMQRPGMPSVTYLSMDGLKQQSLLGPDSNETSRLTKYEVKKKYRLCEAIVNSMLGYGRI